MPDLRTMRDMTDEEIDLMAEGLCPCCSTTNFTQGPTNTLGTYVGCKTCGMQFLIHMKSMPDPTTAKVVSEPSAYRRPQPKKKPSFWSRLWGK